MGIPRFAAKRLIWAALVAIAVAITDGAADTGAQSARVSGSSEGGGQATMSHGSAFVLSPPFPARSFSTRSGFISTYPKLRRCGGTHGRARARRLI